MDLNITSYRDPENRELAPNGGLEFIVLGSGSGCRLLLAM